MRAKIADRPITLQEAHDVEEADYLVVLVTVADAETGLRLGRALVEERLAACVNVVPVLSSIYRWEDSICDDAELLLLIKTRSEVFPRLVSRLRSLHPYQVPEIVAVAAADAMARIGTTKDLDQIIVMAEKRAFRRGFGELTCADVMMPDAVTVRADAQPIEAWRQLRRHGRPVLAVVDEQGRLKGLVGIGDFIENSTVLLIGQLIFLGFSIVNRQIVVTVEAMKRAPSSNFDGTAQGNPLSRRPAVDPLAEICVANGFHIACS